jgi:hypothetical protein
VGGIKVNVDAALSKISRTSMVTTVARDETGKFLGASTIVVAGSSDMEQLEAMACREALVLAADLNL